MSLIVRGGMVYDPHNGLHGERKDIFISHDSIVEECDGDVIDARGLVVMPAGICIHTHIAGNKVDYGRMMRPEDHRRYFEKKTNVTRSGVGYSVPTTFLTGYRYARMGYTTAFEAACPPLGARHAHEELADTPIVDKGIYTLFGNNYFVFKYIQNEEQENLYNFVSWLLGVTKSYTVKVVNPGGVEMWKWGKNVSSIDDPIENYNITPREIIENLVEVVEKRRLPHSVHLHCNNLGQPGNYSTTLDTLKAVRGRRLHLTHLQFHSYGGEDWEDFESEAPRLMKYINGHKNITFDVGQIIFGDTTTMTADGPLQYNLYKETGHKWMNLDVEMETGAGVVPYNFNPKNMVNAIQWAIGLELFLMARDLERICLTTDHPNGGPFHFYPKIISWLMSRKTRNEEMARIHKKARERTSIESLTREYSLSEIVTLTRLAPSRILGLSRKGHLGVGAEADVAIYDFCEDRIEESFSRARYVVKGGKIVVKDGEVVSHADGKTYMADAKGEETDHIRETFKKYYTVSLSNFIIQDKEIARPEVVPCG